MKTWSNYLSAAVVSHFMHSIGCMLNHRLLTCNFLWVASVENIHQLKQLLTHRVRRCWHIVLILTFAIKSCSHVRRQNLEVFWLWCAIFLFTFLPRMMHYSWTNPTTNHTPDGRKRSCLNPSAHWCTWTLAPAAGLWVLSPQLQSG